MLFLSSIWLLILISGKTTQPSLLLLPATMDAEGGVEVERTWTRRNRLGHLPFHPTGFLRSISQSTRGAIQSAAGGSGGDREA